MRRPGLLAFDVNDTLLDLAPLMARVEEMVGEPATEWVGRVFHASLVANEVGWYRPFDRIGVEALVDLGLRRGFDIDDEAALHVVDAMYNLPLHAGVYNALERLFDDGYTMIALTNNATLPANTQIENAGLHVFLQRVVSVDEVELFKPAAEVYLHAASTMEVGVGEMMMVAAHDWDCAGAMACGGRAAMVRAGSTWTLPGRGPELMVDDMTSLVTALTGAEAPPT